MNSQLVDLPLHQEHRFRMTFEEWVAFADEDVHGEWVNGEATVFMTSTGLHQDVIGFLYRLLTWFTEERGLGAVRLAPYAMRLPDLGWQREPDLLFVAQANLPRLTNARLIGPADLVVEVVSDDSVTRDRLEKRAAYEAAGVPEYWLLDPRPRHQEATFLRLDNDGHYQEMPLDDEGRLHSSILPGFWLDPTWLWQNPLPRPQRIVPLILGETNGG